MRRHQRSSFQLASTISLLVLSSCAASGGDAVTSTTVNSDVRRTTSKNIDASNYYNSFVHRAGPTSDSGLSSSSGAQKIASSPWFAYRGHFDDIDQDCEDVGTVVYVGNYDPDELDSDSDGWGCEGWYGGVYLPSLSGGSSYDYDSDLDCEDVGEEVWVGDDDPNRLDADGDGWGCEGW